MPGASSYFGASATPTQKHLQQKQPSTASLQRGRSSLDRDDGGGGGGDFNPGGPRFNMAAPAARNIPALNTAFAPRGSSLKPASFMAPGSFSSELSSQIVQSRAIARLDSSSSGMGLEKVEESSSGYRDPSVADEVIVKMREQLSRELKIKEGTENMLEALNSKKPKHVKDQRAKVEQELNGSNAKIRNLKEQIAEAQRVKTMPSTPVRTRNNSFFAAMGTPGGFRSPRSARSGGSEAEEQIESPTFALAEVLQALEVEGLTPEYYVAKANSLVDLFKKYPTLKYDLVWSAFGPRMQVMLLSDSREMVAAGYRVIRYAISDIMSLKRIRQLKTDYIILDSLIKDRKADLEREQALKLVRAFLDVKEGVREVSRAIVRTVASIAETHEDRLRSMCLETLAEILVRDPQLLLASGGMSVISEALGDGSYKASESLVSAILFLLDDPQRRRFLRSGYELDVVFNVFSDVLLTDTDVLRHNSRAIASALRSWSGLFTLSMYNFRAIRSLIASMSIPDAAGQDVVLDLLFSLFRIKPPAWATSFLAGRRLTTYGRVSNLAAAGPLKRDTQLQAAETEVEDEGQNFVEHHVALLLAVFIRSGLLPSLLRVAQTAQGPILARKSTLLIGELLRLASRLLPASWSTELQLLPGLFSNSLDFGCQEHFISTNLVYQISSVSRTLYRSAPFTNGTGDTASARRNTLSGDDDPSQRGSAGYVGEASMRQLVIDSLVLTSSKYSKWNWEVILKIIEGPLLNGKRLEEAIKASKFIKRIMSFYRPFKFRFSEIRNTKANQKYVRVGCALMHTLLQSSQGVAFLSDNKLIRQIAECLAQCDPSSGLTAAAPLFSPDRLSETLCGGYLAMLGILSGNSKGQHMLDRWRVFNMIYHILDYKHRPDLIKLCLASFNFGVSGHPRVLLGKALTGGWKEMRIYATNTLRRYANTPRLNLVGDSRWAIEAMVRQLYDSDVEVCATAVKILEKACNTRYFLEYIVACRPALDHLGEIGAPLLLRFLSTSIGYHYLDGLDYISNEMDDWFLGRNDAYVKLVEASLSRAFSDHTHEEASHRHSVFGSGDGVEDVYDEEDNHLPPHFYRELTRTQEGCRLLENKGHFAEFASTIADHGMQYEDVDLMTKVKGCMWAVGNVGAMDLGAPFLESCDVVEHIVQIAEEHQVMSMRGTAFFVIGLISRSIHGLEILSEYGWDANTDPLGRSSGFCIPNRLEKFLSLQPWKHQLVSEITLPDTQRTESVKVAIIPSRPRAISLLGFSAPEGEEAQQALADAEVAAAELDPDPVNQQILQHYIDLGNQVYANHARTELSKLQAQRKAPGFAQPMMYRKVVSMMEAHHYRLNSRRMLQLFGKGVLRRVVLDLDEDGGMSRDGDGDGDRDEADRVEQRGVGLGAADVAVSDEEDEEDEDDDDDDEPDTTRITVIKTRNSSAKSATSAAAATVTTRQDETPESDLESDSSGDEEKTERQRSISDPSDGR